MLFVAVLLLLSAVGLLIAALVVGQVFLAWASVGISAVVALTLLLRRRRSRRRRPRGAETELPGGDRAVDAEPAEGRGDRVSDPEPSGTDPDEEDTGEEDTGAAELQVVLELSDEVLVIDEHPRYHLGHCPLPDPARAERLPVREARELGFTPCSRCGPDAALVSRHRAQSAP